MVARKRRTGTPDASRQHIDMLNEYLQLVAWSGELAVQGKNREAASTREAAEILRQRIEQMERDYHQLSR